MNEALYEAVSNSIDQRDSEKKADYEISVPISKLKEFMGEGFIECEAIVPSNNGHPYKSICRMSYEDAIILSELPSEDSTPVPLDLLFDDVAMARAKVIRGGLVRTAGERIYRTELAESAVYLIRKKFRDIRARTLQRGHHGLEDITADDITDVQVSSRSGINV